MTASDRAVEPVPPLRRISSDALRYVPARLAPAVTLLAITFVFTRLLSRTEFGRFGLAIAVAVPAMSIVAEAVAQPLLRYYREYIAAGRNDAYRATAVRLVAGAAGTAGVLAACVVLGFRGRLGAETAVATALYVIVGTVVLALLAILQASSQRSWYAGVVAGIPLGQLAIALAIVRLGSARGAALVWAALGANVLALPVALARAGHAVNAVAGLAPGPVDRAARERTAGRHGGPDAGRFLRYGGPMLMWFAAFQLLGFSDRYLIAEFRGAADVGVYAASYGLATGMASVLGGPLLLAVAPAILDEWRGGLRDPQLERTLSVATGLFAVLVLFVAGGLAVSARHLIGAALGSSFRAGIHVLVPVFLGQCVAIAASIGHKGLELAERTTTLALLAACACVVNIAANVVLVPAHGYLAAAYTTCAGYLVYAAGVHVATRDVLRWRIGWRGVATVAVVVVTAALVSSAVVPSESAATDVVRGVIYVVLAGPLSAVIGRRLWRSAP